MRRLRPRLRFRLKRSRRKGYLKVFQRRATLARTLRWGLSQLTSAWKPTSALYSGIRGGKFHTISRVALRPNRPVFTPNIRMRPKSVRLHLRTSGHGFVSLGSTTRPSLKRLGVTLVNASGVTLIRRCQLLQHLRGRLSPAREAFFSENKVFFKPTSHAFFSRSPMFGLLKCLNFSNTLRSRRPPVSAQYGSPVHSVFPAAQALKVFVFRRLRRQKSIFKRLNLRGTLLTSPRKRLKASSAGAGRAVQGS